MTFFFLVFFFFLTVGGQKPFYKRFLCKFGDLAAQCYNSVPHDSHAGGNLKYFRQSVGDINNPNPPGTQIIYAFKQTFSLIKGKGTGRLIQYQYLRLPQKPSQYLNKLLFSDGKAAGFTPQIHLPAHFFHGIFQSFTQFGRFLFETNQNILFNRHIGKQHRLLGHHINSVGQRH